MGIKFGKCYSQILFCCWNTHLCKIIPEKNVFIDGVLFICYFYDTHFRNLRTLLCFSVCIQLVPKERGGCTLVWDGGVREVLAPSAFPGFNRWELQLSMYICGAMEVKLLPREVFRVTAFSCRDAEMETLAGCFPLRMVLCPRTEQLSNSWLPVSLWNAEQLKTHQMPLTVWNIGCWTELLILNYCVCTDCDLPAAIIKYKKALKQIYRPSSIIM